MVTLTFWGRGALLPGNSGNVNILNLNQTPVTELTFTSTTESEILLEYNNGLPDPDTLLVIDGVSRSFTVELSGTLPGDAALADVNGEDLRWEPFVVITDNLTGTTYFFLISGDTADTLAAFPNGATGAINIDTVTDILLCFAAGTEIATPFGPRRVEDLAEGDLVLDQTGSARSILWIGTRPVCRAELDKRPDLAPVTIAAHAFGPDRPFADLVVSPQHRVRLNGPALEMHFGLDEVLAPAVTLCDGRTIRQEIPSAGVTYFHIMLDRHALVWSNGLLSESFHPADAGIASLTGAARAELFARFPALEARGAAAYGPSCLPTLRGFEARLAQKLLKAGPDPHMVNRAA